MSEGLGLLREIAKTFRNLFTWIHRLPSTPGIWGRRGNVVCGKRGLLIEKLSENLLEMEPPQLAHFLRSFFYALNTSFPLEFRTLVAPLDTGKILRRINRRISTLRVILEENPSAEGARAQLQRLESLKKRIEEETLQPIEVTGIVYVHACGSNEAELNQILNQRVKIVTDIFTSLGIRVKPLKAGEPEPDTYSFLKAVGYPDTYRLSTLIRGRLRKGSFNASYALSVFFPFLMAQEMRSVTGSKITLGRNTRTKEIVRWNISKSISPHILIFGSTGSGKTEVLTILAERFIHELSSNTLIMDVKGEYLDRLRGKVLKVERFVLGEDTGADLCRFAYTLPEGWRAGILTDLLITSYRLRDDRRIAGILYKALSYSLSFGCEDFAETAQAYLERYGDEYLSYRAASILLRASGKKYVKDIIDAVMLFNVEKEKAIIIDLSKIMRIDPGTMRLYLSIMVHLIKSLVMRYRGIVKRPKLIVFDESWMYVKELKDELYSIMRLGRSYGLSIAVATQRPDDLESFREVAIDNSGLLIAMASPDEEFWTLLTKYMRLSREDIKYITAGLGRGEGVARISPNPRPVPIKFF